MSEAMYNTADREVISMVAGVGSCCRDEDRELEEMVNPATAERRANEKGKRCSTAASQPRKGGRGRAVRRRMMDGLTPAMLGVVILGGVVREWMNPAFGILMALGCFGWALALLRGK